MGPQRIEERGVLRQRFGMEFGIAAGQPERIAIGQGVSGKRREEMEVRPQFAKHRQIVGIDEGETGIAGDRDALSFEVRRKRGVIGTGAEGDRRRQLVHLVRKASRAGRDPFVQTGDLVRHQQAEMAFGQGEFGAALHRAQPSHRRAHAVFQHGGMARASHAIGDRAVQRDVAAVGGEAVDDRAEALRHGRTVDHRQHRQAEAGGDIGCRWIAVEQAHHAFDEDDVRFARRLVEKAAAIILAHHEQVEREDRVAARPLEDHRVEEVGPALEHAHPQATIAVAAREGGSDRRLALSRRRRGDQQRGAARAAGQRSMPFCARTPARKACFTSRIELTVSAASMKSSCAARPVITTCCIGGRASIAGMISSSER